jgi:hypothetical protein
MAEEKEKPAGPIPMPVSDVAEWDDDERLKRYGGVPWPMTGRKEEEVLKAAKKLPDPTGD